MDSFLSRPPQSLFIPPLHPQSHWFLKLCFSQFISGINKSLIRRRKKWTPGSYSLRVWFKCGSPEVIHLVDGWGGTSARFWASSVNETCSAPWVGQMCFFFLFNSFFEPLFYTSDSGKQWGEEETQKREATHAQVLSQNHLNQREQFRMIPRFLTWLIG